MIKDSLIGRMQRKFELKQNFSESQILAIFSDICTAVAHMHSQNPPVIHRDLKVLPFFEKIILTE